LKTAFLKATTLYTDSLYILCHCSNDGCDKGTQNGAFAQGKNTYARKGYTRCRNNYLLV